jgi:hypothetical protein
VLTTDQLTLLYFSSTRRAQDRLLFLYRERVVDRFYPPSRFGAGKPQAHWLLDEAGALLVAAMLGVERKQLGWQRREDWGSHPQLAHRLETNRFVTDLIAATLADPGMGVTAWYSSRDAAELLETLRRAYAQLQQAEAERLRQDRWAVAFQPSWPILGAIARELRREGPLARVWQPIDRDGEPLSALPALPFRRQDGYRIQPPDRRPQPCDPSVYAIRPGEVTR